MNSNHGLNGTGVMQNGQSIHDMATDEDAIERKKVIIDFHKYEQNY